SHLKEHEEYYSNLLAQYEINYGSLAGDAIKHWMVNCIQPLIQSVTEGDESKVNRICCALFLELLNLYSHQHDMALFERAWKLFQLTPELFTQKPSAVIKAIDQGLIGVLNHKHNQGDKWLTIMEAALPHCKSIPEMKKVGNLAAWLSGLAHLRSNCITHFNDLSEAIKSSLQVFTPENKKIEGLLNEGWIGNKGDIQLGGFIGFQDGLFEYPPVVGLVNGVVMATDSKTACAVFDDSCGTVILKDINFPVTEIKTSSTKGKGFKEFKDISSSIELNNSIVFTRESSHYIHISALK
ncbi:MAG: hypothetical protein AAFN93_25060, partial [Bacteroidota bacterium]